MAHKNDRLNRALRQRDDEYYTRYDTVEWVVENFLKDRLEDKIIYCNADTEQSNFVKYFKQNKTRLKYKDLWYTSDDYRNHIDLLQKCDIVITNPPFSIFNNYYYPDLLKYAKEYFVFSFHLTGYNVNRQIYAGKVYKFGIGGEQFVRENGDIVNIPIALITNLTGFTNRRYNSKRSQYYTTKPLSKRFEEIEHVYLDNITVDGEKVLYLKKMSDYPIDYYGPVAAPMCSAYLYMDKLDLLEDIVSKDIYVNSKKKFVRTLCRLKR